MSQPYWERGHLYAKLYHLTKQLPEFETAVIKEIGREHLNEAKVAWAAIDQYEGTYRPER